MKNKITKQSTLSIENKNSKITSTKLAKPVLPSVTRDTARGYNYGSVISYLKNGEIKQITQYNIVRNPKNLYDLAENNEYYKSVIYYKKIKNPEYKDCLGRPITQKEYEKQKCAVKSRKSAIYKFIPLKDYEKYGLKNKSGKISFKKFLSEYNDAVVDYSPKKRVNSNCF